MISNIHFRCLHRSAKLMTSLHFSSRKFSYLKSVNETRMRNNAMAVHHVTQLLNKDFHCVRPVENGSCMIAVTKDDTNYLPMNVRFSAPRWRVNGSCRFHFDLRYRGKGIQFLAGYFPNSTQPVLWHMSQQELKDFKFNTTKKKKIKHIAITIGCPSDLNRRITDADIPPLVEQYWQDKSLFVLYDAIMTKGTQSGDVCQVIS